MQVAICELTRDYGIHYASTHRSWWFFHRHGQTYLTSQQFSRTYKVAAINRQITRCLEKQHRQLSRSYCCLFVEQIYGNMQTVRKGAHCNYMKIIIVLHHYQGYFVAYLKALTVSHVIGCVHTNRVESSRVKSSPVRLRVWWGAHRTNRIQQVRATQIGFNALWTMHK
jgi:hypothetical protein